MGHANGDAMAALAQRVEAAIGAAGAGRDGVHRNGWGERRPMPLSAPSTRDVIAGAVAARARAQRLVRQAEEVRREAAAVHRRAATGLHADRE